MYLSKDQAFIGGEKPLTAPPWTLSELIFEDVQGNLYLDAETQVQKNLLHRNIPPSNCLIISYFVHCKHGYDVSGRVQLQITAKSKTYKDFKTS